MNTKQIKATLIAIIFLSSILVGYAFGYMFAFETFSKVDIAGAVFLLGVYVLGLDVCRATYLKLDGETNGKTE